MSQEPDQAAQRTWSALRDAAGRVDSEPRLLVDFSRWVLAAGDAAAIAVLRAVAEAVEPG